MREVLDDFYPKDEVRAGPEALPLTGQLGIFGVWKSRRTAAGS
jgi:hypothetical protein